jgi:hypothetical protein
LVIMLQKRQRSSHMLALVLFSEHPWHPSYRNFFVLEICTVTILQINKWEIRGNFSWILSRVKRLFVIMCNLSCFSSLLWMRDGHSDHSSSWTFVLLSVNIQHHFLTFDPFITFAIHCNKLIVKFNQMDITCIQKPNYSSHFTIGGVLGFFFFHWLYKPLGSWPQLSVSWSFYRW